jgi:hypothetical protein
MSCVQFCGQVTLKVDMVAAAAHIFLRVGNRACGVGVARVGVHLACCYRCGSTIDF